LEATYHVELRGDSLVLVHWRQGPLPLTPLRGQEFGTGEWFLKSVAFTRGANERADGLVMNVEERSRDIRFKRPED
jgi:hypothetical protein